MAWHTLKIAYPIPKAQRTAQRRGKNILRARAPGPCCELVISVYNSEAVTCIITTPVTCQYGCGNYYKAYK